MPRRTIGAIAGALAAASLAAPAAHAASPASVSVRVEAPSTTLVARTVTTRRAPVVKDGDPAHRCTGTSAAGALEQATGGSWTASWFDGLGYAVDAIDGVAAPADFSAYWTLWVNGRSSSTGLCDTELQPRDEVLLFLCTSTADFSSCENLPLAMRAVRSERSFVTVEVVRLKGDGTSEPAAGAIVRGGEQPVRTGANGRARVGLVKPGQATLRATRTGDVPSARLHCRVGPRKAACGSRDRTPPRVRVRGIADGARFAPGAGPRLLRGSAIDPEGATVALRLIRRLDGRCAAYHENREAFRPCGRRLRKPFEVSDRRRWSFLLPRRLGPGRYVLQVRATDGAGNRGGQRVRFTVEP